MPTLDQIRININNGFSSVTDLIPKIYNFGDEPYYWTDPDTTDFSYYGWADVVFIQSDGKIIVGGRSGLYDNSIGGYSVLKRFNTDGSLDESFTSPKFCGNYDGYIRDVGQQSDGKLIVVGHFTSVDGDGQNRIARLNTDGSLDNTFSIVQGFNGNALVCKVLADDCILVGGNFSSYNSSGNSRLLKLNSSGAIDATFAGNISITNTVHAIAIDSGGSVYAGGNFGSRIIKLNINGTTDGSFDPGSGFNDRVTAIQIQSDGKIIVGGWFEVYNGSSCNPGVVRLETSGAVDGTFASEGTGIEEWSGLSVQALEIQSDGKIVAVGWFVVYDGTLQRGIIRLNTDGKRDTSLVTGLGFSDRAQDVKIDTSGNIYVAGFFYYYNGSPTTVQFNYLDSKQAGCAVKLSPNGTMLGAVSKQNIFPVCIEDGGRDMFDSGLFINTNLNQPYGYINDEDSLPYTHSVLFFCDASEGIDWAMYDPNIGNYNWVPTVFNGDVVPSDNIFGIGSTYFTNQYPGLFVMGTDNAQINELSLTGGTGKDGDGDFASGSFDFVLNDKTYGVFYKSTYNNNQDDETNVQQVIIIDRSVNGITQEFYSPYDRMDQVLTGVSNAKNIFILVFASNYLNNALPESLIRDIAIKFITISLNRQPVKRKPAGPKLKIRIKTYDPAKLQSQLLPDNNSQNIINQLKNQTVWLPNWSYPLKNGDEITVYGQQAVRLYKDIRYLNNGEFNVVEVLYYGFELEEKTTNNIFIFTNDTYVDYVANPDGEDDHEVNNLMLDMDEANLKYEIFKQINESSWKNICSKADVIIIPELENNDLLPDLTSEAQGTINNFVDKGGTLVMFSPGSGDPVAVINSIFGFSIAGEGGNADNPITLTEAGASLFTGLSSTIPNNDGTFSLDTSTLPESAVVVYKGDGSNQSVVTKIYYGEGQIYMLGWDWYGAKPLGYQDGGWIDLLIKILKL